MPMSPEVMQALSQNKPAGGAPPSPAPGPASAGAMMPQKPAGAIENGRLKVLAAVKVLEQALSTFGAMGKEGKAVLGAITALSKTFGKQEGDVEDLQASEKKTIAGGLAGPGGSAPPQAGGAPGGAPPVPPQAPPGGGAPQMAA